MSNTNSDICIRRFLHQWKRYCSSTSGNTWTAVYTADANDTDGAVSYSIAFSDTAGNAGSAVTSGSGSVTTDTTAPTQSVYIVQQ